MKSKKRVVKSGGLKNNTELEDTSRRIRTHEPIREEKMDRNAPCACGSGKKQKKCCGATPGWWARIKAFLGLA